MSRRTLTLALLVPATAFLLGCSTVEGQRAQELLLQSQAAEAQLTSSTFAGGLEFTVGGKKVALQFEGGGSKAGGYMSMRASGMTGLDLDLDVVARGGKAWLRTGNGWQSVPAPEAFGAGRTGSLGSAAFQELTKHVKDVRVTEHQLVGGKQVSIVAGELDTEGLVEAAARLGGLQELAGSSFDLEKLGVDLGDIRAVLTIDETTHLLTSALVELELKAQGETVELALRYRLTSANEPVALPAAPA